MGDGIPRSPPRAISADRHERFPSDLLAISVRPACNLMMVGCRISERRATARRSSAGSCAPSRGRGARRDGGEFLARLTSHPAADLRPGSGRDRSRSVPVVDTSAVLEAIVAREAGARRANNRGWRPPCAPSHRHRAASCHLTPNRPRRAGRSARFGPSADFAKLATVRYPHVTLGDRIREPGDIVTAYDAAWVGACRDARGPAGDLRPAREPPARRRRARLSCRAVSEV